LNPDPAIMAGVETTH